MPIFHGDDRPDENATDFLRGIQRRVYSKVAAGGSMDAECLVLFPLCLKADSVADRWYSGLDAGDKGKWPDLERKFLERWKTAKAVERSEAEIEKDMTALTITEAELGEKVEYGGSKVWTHVAFASKMTRLVEERGLGKVSLFIGDARARLPDGLKDQVGTAHADWTAFCRAIREVDVTQLQDYVERRKRTERERLETERKLSRLDAAIRAAATQSPTASIRQGLANTSLSSTFGPQLPGPPLASRATGPRPVPDGDGNPFTASGGGAGGLRFTLRSQPPFAPRPNPVRSTITQDDIDAINTGINKYVHHPNTADGIQKYKRDFEEWLRDHPDGRVTRETPVPLRPGTSSVCCGECFRCGANDHRSPECPVKDDPTNPARLPAPEGNWRAICGRVLGTFNRGQAAPVHLVLDGYGERLSWEDREHQVSGSGKGEGPPA